MLDLRRENCPHNVVYESFTTVVEHLTSISNALEIELLDGSKSSALFSIMADESTDSASQEELSMCDHWLHNKPIKKFLEKYMLKQHIFLHCYVISIETIHGRGFDSASTMSGHKSGMQK